METIIYVVTIVVHVLLVYFIRKCLIFLSNGKELQMNRISCIVLVLVGLIPVIGTLMCIALMIILIALYLNGEVIISEEIKETSIMKWLLD